MGITQPGGAGTTIYLYDDTDATNHAAAPGPHTFTEIATAFPADFIDNGTPRRDYRSKVSVQIGDATSNAATTTLTDKNCNVTFDATKTLLYRAAAASSWFTTLGTKIGTGSLLSGAEGVNLTLAATTTLRGTFNAYGCTITQTTGNLLWQPPGLDFGEAANTLFQHTVTGFGQFNFGSATVRPALLYNVNFSHLTTNQVLFAAQTGAMDRITVAGTSCNSFVSTSIPNFTVKRVVFIGSPTLSDVRWVTTAGSVDYRLIQPTWSQNAPKFSVSLSGPDIDRACWELWGFGVKTVDQDGIAIPGIPIRLTDVTGVVAVDTVTGMDGSINFGSGLFENVVTVMDHYVLPSTTTYVQRHRSPFHLEVNRTGAIHPNYQSRHMYFNWPGYEDTTTSSGQFEDVLCVFNLEEPSGGLTPWTELVL